MIETKEEYEKLRADESNYNRQFEKLNNLDDKLEQQEDDGLLTQDEALKRLNETDEKRNKLIQESEETFIKLDYFEKSKDFRKKIDEWYGEVIV